MNITTFYFAIFVAISVMIYYLCPLKWRWLTLLASNAYFVYCSNTLSMLMVMLVMILLAYIAGVLFDKYQIRLKMCKVICTAVVVILAGILIGLKETNFFIVTGNHIGKIWGLENGFELVSLIAPLGISYFALTLISYVCDSYWKVVEPEKNPLKFATYASFFPLLTSGPVLQYDESYREIISGHKFQYRNICFGLQRILWGLFKKLVISERIAVIVNTIYGDPEQYTGLYVLLAAAGFALQLYTDFSGCIDILLGVAQLYGITLPENFDLPFASANLSEFWRRWHITLGRWLKSYILYPVLRSAPLQRLGKITGKKLGKKNGKKIPTWVGLLISWFMIGFWHGGTYNYIFGVGVFFGIAIVLGEVFAPLFDKIILFFDINTKRFSWRLFQTIRTLMLFCFGLSFFKADSVVGGFKQWQMAFSTWNPWILFDGSLYRLGLDEKDFRLLLIMLLVLAAGGVMRIFQKRPIREWLAEQGLIFRWSAYIILIFIIIIYGKYGPGYDAVAFIYGNF